MSTRLFTAAILILCFCACVNDPSHEATSGTNASPNADTVASTGAPLQNIMDIMIRDLHSLPLTNDPDHDFALMLKRHHQAAIEMANVEITRGGREGYKELARKIMEDSRKDVNELTNFLTAHKPAKNADFAKKAMDVMMKSNDGAAKTDSSRMDERFYKLMSLHHQQGIDMAKTYLPYASQDAPRKVAQRVIENNEADLKKLESAKQ